MRKEALGQSGFNALHCSACKVNSSSPDKLVSSAPLRARALSPRVAGDKASLHELLRMQKLSNLNCWMMLDAGCQGDSRAAGRRGLGP